MYLIIPDLDTNILDNLYPPLVLTMSEVNRYYHKLLKDKIDSLNRYKLNPEYMGDYYPCGAFKWFIETREEKNIRKNTGLFFQQLFEYSKMDD